MIDLETVREKCLSLREVTEQDHFGKPSYRVRKKIFATLWLEEKRIVLKLSTADQLELCERNPTIFYPVKGGWGKQGATNVELNEVSLKLLENALTKSWCEVAPEKLVKQFKS